MSHIFYSVIKAGEDSPAFIAGVCYSRIYTSLDIYTDIVLYFPTHNNFWRNYDNADYSGCSIFSEKVIKEYVAVLNKMNLKITVDFDIEVNKEYFPTSCTVFNIDNNQSIFCKKLALNCIRYLYEWYDEEDYSYQEAIHLFLTLLKVYPRELPFNLLNFSMYLKRIRGAGHNHLSYCAYKWLKKREYLKLSKLNNYIEGLSSIIPKTNTDSSFFHTNENYSVLLKKYKKLC